MRPTTLATTSVVLVLLAGAAILDAANAQVLAPPILAEEKLAVASTTPAVAPYGRDPIQTLSNRRSVVVGAGDTVYALSRRFAVAPAEIIRANNLAAPYQLEIGQTLIMPTATDRAELPGTVAAPPPASLAVPVAISAATTAPAPIVNGGSSLLAAPRIDGIYTVKPGDTLFSLARRFDVDIIQLAEANGIAAPYSLSIGQRVTVPAAAAAQPARVPSLPAEIAPPTLADAPPVYIDRVEPISVSKTPESRFAWPLRGAITRGYGTGQDGVRNDGINIAAPIGSPIRAAADGEVVYTGAELEGYGNLLLIKHEDGWVSAYAHADSIIVRKGERVRQGQVVAKVGRTGAVEQPQLHFELRHELQPRNPLEALNGTDIKAAAIDQ